MYIWFSKRIWTNIRLCKRRISFKTIKIDLIKDELLKDIKCFPGYVSGFYSDKEYEDIPEIETLEIKDLEIHDYYVIKNISRDTYTIQISLAVQ